MLRFWSEFEVFWGVCWDFGVSLRFFGVFVGFLVDSQVLSGLDLGLGKFGCFEGFCFAFGVRIL